MYVPDLKPMSDLDLKTVLFEIKNPLTVAPKKPLQVRKKPLQVRQKPLQALHMPVKFAHL